MQIEKVVENANNKKIYKNLSNILEKSEKQLQEGKVHNAREMFGELRRKYNY